ncbi:MAG: RNA methyltransferase [Steroidobacteraceae bacterium]
MHDVRFVLVEPSHPGNIGAVARAMKNMALERLVLVRPRQFPHPEATARASGAEAVLREARVVGTVAEAVAGCGFVAATTSRDRDQNFRVLEARAAAARLCAEAERGPVAVLFGAERTGLTNDDLESSHALVRIPADSLYASLNLGMAAQIVAYELYLARVERGSAPSGREAAPPAERTAAAAPLAPPEEMARLYAHLAEVMDEVGFRDRTQSGTNLMGRIRRFLQRAELDQNEVAILRGLLTAVQNRRRPAGGGGRAGADGQGAAGR